MKKLKKIFCLVFAAAMWLFAVGCATQPTAADAHRMVAEYIFNSTYNAKISGVVRDNLAETESKIDTQYYNDPTVGYSPNFSEDRFMSFIASLLERVNGGEYAEVAKVKDGYSVALDYKATGFTSLVMRAVIENLDKPLIDALDATLKVLLGDKVADIRSIADFAIDVVADNPTIRLVEYLNKLDEILQGVELDSKTLINTFVPNSVFYDEDGCIADGFTLYETPYLTLTKSAGKLQFLTVAALLSGTTQPMSVEGFGALVGGYLSKLDVLTWQYLSELIKTDLSFAAANKKLLKPLVENVRMSGMVYTDKKLGVKSLSINFSGKVGVTVSGNPIIFFDREGELSAVITSVVAD